MADEKKPDGDDTKDGTTPKVVPIPLIPTKRKLSDAHLANLRASGLTDETIAAAALYTEERPAALAELTQRRTWNRLQGSALVFPFYGAAADSGLVSVRVRPTTPLTETQRNGKKRLRKYDQASAAGVLVYYTPRARAANAYTDVSRVLYWTEGEKKALVFDQEGLTCVGLTGVWLWLDSAHRRDSGEERLHPTITESVTIAGRAHVIVFDADSRKNDHVMMAAQRLAGVLLAAGAVSVRFVCPPDVDAAKGIDDYYALHGATHTAALLATAETIDPIDPKQPLVHVRRAHAYRDAAHIPEALRVPGGYELRRDGGLWTASGDERRSDALLTQSPMFVTRKLVDAHSGEFRVELAYVSADGAPLTIAATRRAIADSRTMVAELAAQGAPVHGGNAGKLVEWFAAFEHVNAAAIPCVTSVANTGWHVVDGARVFVAGAAIGADPDAPPTLALDTRGDRRRMFAALVPRGTLAGHVAALQRAWEASPVCAAVIAGALAAPLLEPLRAPNFAIHLVGESSRGKTSMLRCAASVFGDPASPQWLASWNATATGAELRAATLNDLPQCYDEIGGGDAQAAERMLYALINGGGRTRATRDLTTRETATWRTVVLSTGERELADESTATGAQIRVVQLPVDGFGKLTAAQVDALRAECAAHSGMVGRAWLEELASIDDWPHYRDALANVTAKLRDRNADPLQGRVAAYFGLLALVEAMVSESFGIGRKHTFSDLFNAQTKRETVEGIADRAREAVMSWVESEPDAFPELAMGPHGGLDTPKSNGVRTRHGYRKADGTVLIIPSEFRAFAKRSRLTTRAVVREWDRKGWTELDAGRLDKAIRIGPTTNRYIILLPPTSYRTELP